MGWFKSLIKRFACRSKCSFNTDSFDNDLLNVDLRQYQLKAGDLMAIDKIIRKRPSIHTYKHNNIDQITVI